MSKGTPADDAGAGAQDAEIFRLAESWFAAQRALQQVHSCDEEDLYDRLISQQVDALRDLLQAVPVTTAGLEAKAAAVTLQMRLMHTNGGMAVSSTLAPSPPIGPDALGQIDLHNLIWYLRRDIAVLAQRHTEQTGAEASQTATCRGSWG